MADQQQVAEPVLVAAKRADQLYTVRPKALRKLRVAVKSLLEPRPARKVRAIPYGVRGWRYVSQDIPLALAEDAEARRAG